MKECYLCGASERETVLYEGIYESLGIVYVPKNEEKEILNYTK